MGQKITEKINKRKPILHSHMKYVDDLSLLQSLNLKESLLPNPVCDPPRHLAYRTNQVLPTEIITLQDQLDRLEKYCQEKEMKINIRKCKVMIFTPTGTTLECQN